MWSDTKSEHTTFKKTMLTFTWTGALVDDPPTPGEPFSKDLWQPCRFAPKREGTQKGLDGW